jgi:perosamine synthetase
MSVLDYLDKINRYIVDEDDIDRVIQVLKQGLLSKPEGGPTTEAFQRKMAVMHDKKFAYAINSGTSALHCAILALELERGDEVIVPALANIADCSTVMQEGGTPVFVDIDPDDFNIDPQKIEDKITNKTKAIIVVHMYGQPAKVDEIRAIADRHNLILIEDCAQAAGAKIGDMFVGSFGDISCFSLYQTKHIISGEGGIVLTNSIKYIKIISSSANNGIMQEDLDAYDYDRIGFNYQITEIQTALALGQLEKLESNNDIRRKNVAKIKELLSDLDITFQKENEGTINAYFYLAVLLPEHLASKRDDFINLVKEMGVPMKKLYPLSLPEVTLFRGLSLPECSVAQAMTKRVFNIYVNPGLDESDMRKFSEIIKQVYEKISEDNNNG